MKILVTGAHGFVGHHLTEYLKSRRHEVVTIDIDLLNATDTAVALSKVHVDGVIHLAAVAMTGASHESPAKVLRNNIFAELNVLEVLRRQKTIPRILIIGSADEYGRSAEVPITEHTLLAPTSPYAVSKIAQDYMGLQYFLAYGLPIIRVRPFNHIGAGQGLGFVIPDFAKQIAIIEQQGKSGVIKVGNLDTIRDFTDVRDMVRAYEVALTRGAPGDVYNIGSGRGVTIRSVLEQLISYSTATISIHVDPLRFRPGDEPKLVCDPKKFVDLTGWKPSIPLPETLRWVLEYWRDRVRGQLSVVLK